MQIERKGEFAQFRFRSYLVLHALFQVTKGNHLQAVNFRHQLLGFFKGLGCQRLAVFPRASDGECLLEAIILDPVRKLDIGNLLIEPEVTRTVKVQDKGEGDRYPTQDRFIYLIAESTFHIQIYKEVIPGIGYDDVGEPGFLGSGKGLQKEYAAESHYADSTTKRYFHNTLLDTITADHAFMPSIGVGRDNDHTVRSQHT